MTLTPVLLTATDVELAPGVTFGPIGMTFADTVTVEEWTAAGPALGSLDQATAWNVGDWLLKGEEFGVTYHDACARSGMSWNTVVNRRSVALLVTADRRRPELSWSHHDMVSRLRPDDQVLWLEFAVKHELSADALREQINVALDAEAVPDPTPTPAPERPQSHDKATSAPEPATAAPAPQPPASEPRPGSVGFALRVECAPADAPEVFRRLQAAQEALDQWADDERLSSVVVSLDTP